MRSCSPAWRSVALSDDVKLYDATKRKITMPPVCPDCLNPTAWWRRRTIIWTIIPAPGGSTTVGVSDTSVKTFSRSCRYGHSTVNATRPSMNDPARRTVAVGRWCRTSVTGNWTTQHKMQYVGQREQRGLLKFLPARRLQYQPSILRTIGICTDKLSYRRGTARRAASIESLCEMPHKCSSNCIW